ncbi:MAG: LPS-assembly protein LptD [Gammaproteobacteria bacterium]|nr:LPS-assembly protein LptD [Gammaproteobacteria bacterium]
MYGIFPHVASTLFFLSSLFITLTSQHVFAETNSASPSRAARQTDSLCPANNSSRTELVQPPVFPPEKIGNTEISADFTQSGSDGSITLDGNVIIERHLLRLTADHAHYDKQQDLLQISGNVHVYSEAMSLNADAGTIKMITTGDHGSKQGNFNNTKFFIADSNMKGVAEAITSNEGTDNNPYSVLTNASITSCDLVDPDWLISADEIWLDHEDEYGSAKDVVVRFKNVPFLYTPYIEFPTSDKRRSGFLFPEIGNSSSRGVEITLPWYWNIAPNQDAVIVPHNMVKRGFEIGGEYRYLTRSTNGELKGAYLADDKITEEARYQVRYLQHSRIMSNLLLDIDLQDISDSNYFNDFSNSLGSTSQTHLFRRAEMNYNLKDWHARALLQDIKTIDTTTPVSSRPYKVLPQLTLNGETDIADSPLYFTLGSEFVDFKHEDDMKVTGNRLTVTPGLRLPLGGTAWFFEPAVKLSHTQYDVGIEESGTSEDINDRDLPMSSIDGGLFFERYLDSGYLQTLEPRLYYLYVPYENQNNIPLFDTSTAEFNVSQLFRDNRFVGGDRIGDANQLTLALNSRIMDPATGDEFLRVSIGRIYYFEDRRVSLNNTIDTASQSDIIAELDTRLGHWQNNLELQWNTENDEFSKSNYFLHYQSDARHIFNMGYRRHLNNGVIDIEQSDVSFVYPVSRQYSAFGRWNYSLLDYEDIDIIGGIAYDSCCWSIQLLAQRRRNNTTAGTITSGDDYDNAILVQFVFKGMGSISGNKARTTLEQSIYGYTDIFQ